MQRDAIIRTKGFACQPNIDLEPYLTTHFVLLDHMILGPGYDWNELKLWFCIAEL